jgi:putative hydrolases of HD superfamily
VTAHGVARFVHRIGRLKRVPRTGWLDRGVPPLATESVADHTFRVALLAWLAADEATGLDRNRVLTLALLHDLAEAITGDLPPYDPEELSKVDRVDRTAMLNQRHVRDASRSAAKRAAEAAAITDLVADLPFRRAAEITDLSHELRDGTSPEARFVKQVDKLETYLQSREYVQTDPQLAVESFALEVAEVIDIPALVELRDAIAGVVETEGSSSQ